MKRWLVLLAACAAKQPAAAPSAAPSNREAEPPPPRRHTVLVVDRDDVYLEGALLVCDAVELVKATPEEYAADPRRLAEARVVIFDDVTPDDVPPVNAIYFHARAPVPIARTLGSAPRVTSIAEKHPVMRDVTLSDASFGALDVFAPRADEGEQAIGWSGADPVIVARIDGDRKLLAFGFSLADTDLTLRVSFPLLLDNALAWVGGPACRP